MINTVNTKQQQLTKGAFKIGSGSTVVLLIGSCRSVSYLIYLNRYNELNGNPLTIYFIDPFNWNWDLKNNRTDFESVIKSLETNEYILNIFRTAKIYIHEYYENYGMFNTKNIYNFGLNPEIDVCLPNFNNKFILFNDILTFDSVLREKAIKDYSENNKLSDETITLVRGVANNNINKFYDLCMITGLPEFAEYFKSNYKTTRLFWTSNHVSKYFTLEMFRLLNEKYLKFNLSEQFWNDINKDDMFANNYTYLSEYDGYEWGEEVKPLKEKL